MMPNLAFFIVSFSCRTLLEGRSGSKYIRVRIEALQQIWASNGRPVILEEAGF
jgi:LSD1 subclass zinc finger protein